TDRGHAALDRRRIDAPGLRHPGERIDRRDTGTRDRRRPRAAVGLHDIAIEPQRVLAEREIVEHRANTPADQALYLLRAATELPALPRHPRPRRPRQHRTIGRDPAQTTALAPTRHAVFHGRRA